MPWRWNELAKRYQQSGPPYHFLSRTRALELVDESIQSATVATDELARLWTDGQLSATDLRGLLRREVKNEYLRQGIFGKGGREQMTFSDWGTIGNQLRGQYAEIEKTLNDLITYPDLTEGQVKVRFGNYMRGARQAYERLHTVSQGLPPGVLPDYPGAGNTQCSVGCKCNWRIEETEDSWLCYWTLEPGAEHCPDCLIYAAQWNPLTLLKSEVLGVEERGHDLILEYA